MKPLVLTLLIGLLFSTRVTAQYAGIRAEVYAEENSIPYVSVVVKKAADSTVVKTALTDSAGEFKVQLAANTAYFIELHMLGYHSITSKIYQVLSNILDVGRIEMTRDAQTIGAVQFSALRPIIEVQADKTVFNVENTINATGSDGFDLLRKAPGVVIDQNNGITLEGKGGVMIYIDGKPSVLSGDDLINFLRTLQSTDIDAIELITQPSSKYDAAGSAGIINIKLKRNKNMGTNGSLNFGHGYGKNHRSNGALSLNHRNKKLNIYSNFSANTGKRWNFVLFDRLQEGVKYVSETNTQNSAESYNAKIGADWFVGKHSIIGVLVNGNYFNADGSGTSMTDIIPMLSPETAQQLNAGNATEGRNYQLMGNLNYRYADPSGRAFNVDLDRGMFDRDQNTYQPNEYTDGSTGELLNENNYRMITPSRIDISTAKMDYSQKVLGGVLALGVKYSLVSTDNTFEFYDVDEDGKDELNTDRSNRFIYDENVNAAYVNFSRTLTARWKFQAGLRAEQTNSRGELISVQEQKDNIVDRKYTNLFPSAGLTYSASQKHMWSLTSGRRVQRPNYQSLNPFTTQISELSYRQGNPFLQPQFIWNTKISHTYKYRFNTSFSYSHVKDFSAQVTDTLGSTSSFLIPRNVANQEIYNLGLSLPLRLTKWWSIFVNSNNSYTRYTGTDEKYTSIDIFTSGFYAQSSFMLPKGFKLELSGWGRTPSIWGGTYLTKSMGAMNIGAEKKFLDNNLSMRLQLSDIFYTSPWRAHLQYGPLEISGKGGWESRRLNFSVNYVFGNKNVKASRKRETGAADEQNRTQ